MIQIYTGDGKGKTTAALGQVIRALGHGFRICYIAFFKSPKKWEYGEIKILKKLGIKVFCFAPCHPHFYPEISFSEVRKECLKGLEFVRELLNSKSWDMLILDELNIALRDGFLKEEVLTLLDTVPENLEVILTGRGAPKKIVERADLVSKIEKIKHPFDRGVSRRAGIEY